MSRCEERSATKGRTLAGGSATDGRNSLVELACRASDQHEARSHRGEQVRGFELLYGFPNREAMRASAHLGCSHIGGVRKFVRPLRSDAFGRLPTSLRPFAALALRAWPTARCGAFTLTVQRQTYAKLASLLTHRSSSTGANL